jgi:hypothetical protein
LIDHVGLSKLAWIHSSQRRAELHSCTKDLLRVFGSRFDPDVEILCKPRLGIEHDGVAADEPDT